MAGFNAPRDILTKRGFAELTDGGHIDDFPRLTWEHLQKRVQVSDRTLAHELDVMDVKAVVCAAVAKTNHFRIEEFSTWPKLYEFEAMAPPEDRLPNPRLIVRPDGFIRIVESDEKGPVNEHTFFLEVDRSNESQGVLTRKACCYRDYYRRGGFAERCGLSRHDYEKAPFVVLMVFKTEARRDNTAESLLALAQPILSQVWLTTLDKLLSDPLDTIWVRPMDYRQADADSEITCRAFLPKSQ